MKYKIITTKEIYWTKGNVKDIITYFTQTEYGKKPMLPFFKDMDGKTVAVNPQYVVAIEKHENTV